MNATRRLVPEDVFAFTHVAEFALSPPGTRVAAVVVARDRATDRRIARLRLWEAEAGWTDIAETTGASTPRWSPDGRRLAFLRRDAGQSSLIVLDAASGAATTLLYGPAGLRELAWSPDGSTLAFQRQEPEAVLPWLSLPTPGAGESWAPAVTTSDRLLYRHDTVGILPHAIWQTFILPSAGGTPEQVTEGPWFSGFYAPPGLGFTPDGKGLILAASRRADWDMAPNDIPIQHIEIASRAVTRLTHEAGAQAAAALSPDGATLAYTAVEERHLSGQTRHVYLRDMASGATRRLAPALDRGTDTLAWTADGTALLLACDVPGSRAVLRATLDGNTSTLVANLATNAIEMPYQGGVFSLASTGALATLQGGIDQPGDLTLHSPNGDTTRLTGLNDTLAAAVGGFRPAEVLHVPASSDGAPIHAWLMLPHGRAPAAGWPVILEIHGGPYAAYGERFSIKHQMLAAAGYAVLFANPRGSIGYGEAFATALHDSFPGPDYADLMDVMDAVCARPDIDTARQFITGVSGGGTLTLWAIGHTKRFRAAVSIKPVVAWESWMLTADIGPSVGRVWMNGQRPWENPEKFRAFSPLTHLVGATTPTLIMAGEADSRTPISEAEQAYACLKMQGVDAAFARFPGTSHSTSTMRPSHIAAEVAATLGWLGRFE